jgi:5'(3')-deoxyribonucleotidase
MTIIIDIDDTLCNLQEVVVNLFNERYGARYSIEDFTEYDVLNVLPTQDGMAMRDMYGEIGLYNKVKPLRGAREALQKLVNIGHQVYLVTAAVPKTYGEKVEFIKRHFPFIDDSHIVCMKHKWLLNADIMIEDNLSTLLAKPSYHRILMDMPWNRDVHDWAYGIHRCHNWNEILTAINKINELE